MTATKGVQAYPEHDDQPRELARLREEAKKHKLWHEPHPDPENRKTPSNNFEGRQMEMNAEELQAPRSIVTE